MLLRLVTLVLAGALALAATAAGGTAPEMAWTARVGGNESRPAGVAFDSQGNVFTAATVIAAGKRRELELTKRSRAGRVLWRRTLGGTRDERGLAVAVGHDGMVYVTGSAESELIEGQPRLGQRDLLLAAYTPTGVLRWVRRWGDCNSSGGVALSPVRGGIAVVVDHTGSDIPCHHERQAWYAPESGLVLRYDRSGDLRWETPVRFDEAVDSELNAVANNGEDTLYVSGWTVTWSGKRMQVSAARLSPAGRVQWAKVGLVPGSGSTTGVAILKGRVFIVGSRFALPRAEQRPAPFLAEIDVGDGSMLWMKEFERAGFDRGIAALAVDNDGTLLLAGWESKAGHGRTSHGWLAGVTAEGLLSWSAVDRAGERMHTGVAVGHDRRIAVASVTYSPNRAFVSVYRQRAAP